MSQTPLSQFMNELTKHNLLTQAEEVQKFTRLGALKDELIVELNRTAIFYNKIPGLLFLLADGYEAVKTFIEPYKHDLRTKQLTPHVIATLEQYQQQYQQKVIQKKPELKEALDELSLGLAFEPSYVVDLAEEVLHYDNNDPLVDMHCTVETFDQVQGNISSILRELRAVRQEVVNANLRLVVNIARKMSREHTHLQLIDLIQEGSIGLMKAAERFDVTSGNKFSTVATVWIRQAITRSLQNNARTIRVPVNVQEHLNKAVKTMQQLAAKLKRVPNEQEMADVMGIPLARYKELQAALTNITSLDAPAGGEDDNQMTLQDVIADAAASADMEIYSEQVQAMVREAMTTLTERELLVISHRYGFDGDEKSLSETGAIVGCAKQTVQNVENKALLKLHRHLCDSLQ